MFTKINKVVLWIFIIGGAIASIAVGASVKGMGWFVPVGILATLIISASFGMMIEISENIRESRDYLYELKNKTGGAPNTSNAYSAPPSGGRDKNFDSTASKLSAIANGGSAPQVPDFWYCRDCGTKNDRLASTCKGCGKYK